MTYLCAFLTQDDVLNEVRAVPLNEWSTNRELKRIKLPPNADLESRVNDNWSYDWDGGRFMPPAPPDSPDEGTNSLIRAVLEALVAIYQKMNDLGYPPTVDPEFRKTLVKTLTKLRQADQGGE